MSDKPNKCCSCDCEDSPDCPVTFGPDPYAQDVSCDDTPVWECENCRFESAMDI